LAITAEIFVDGDAQAQNGAQSNQWPTKCEFAAFEQCLQAIWGKTALCDRNPQYATLRRLSRVTRTDGAVHREVHELVGAFRRRPLDRPHQLISWPSARAE
jgi:hypothetical protein